MVEFRFSKSAAWVRVLQSALNMQAPVYTGAFYMPFSGSEVIKCFMVQYRHLYSRYSEI